MNGDKCPPHDPQPRSQTHITRAGHHDTSLGHFDVVEEETVWICVKCGEILNRTYRQVGKPFLRRRMPMQANTRKIQGGIK